MTLAAAGMLLSCTGAHAHGADTAKYFAVAYVCDGGAKLRAAYPDDPLSDHRITLRYSGQRVLMSPAISGSGARYESKKRHLEWWIKGDAGTLSDTGTGKPLLQCRASSAFK